MILSRLSNLESPESIRVLVSSKISFKIKQILVRGVILLKDAFNRFSGETALIERWRDHGSR
jgi:hypothetical protein